MNLSFADALIKEMYLSKIQLAADMKRVLFYDPNPPYGPPVPAWVASNKLFDDAPLWDPPDSYWEDHECPCCS